MMGGGFDFKGRLWMDWDDLVHILLRAYIFNHQYTNVPVDSQSVTEAKALTSEYVQKNLGATGFRGTSASSWKPWAPSD